MTSTRRGGRRRNRSGGGSAKARRSAARLAAVQVLYQIDLVEGAAEAVLAEFIKHRLGHEVDGEHYVAADPALLSAVVRGTAARLAEIDGLIAGALDPRLGLERMEPLLRAIMRAGAWELLDHHDVHPRIVLTEYIEVAKAFYQGREAGVVNGVLDALAHRLRAGEMATAAEPDDDDDGGDA